MTASLQEFLLLSGLRWPVLTRLLETGVRASLLIVAAVLIGLFLRRRSAVLRRALWNGVVLALVGLGLAGSFAAISEAARGSRSWIIAGAHGSGDWFAAVPWLAIWLVPAALLLIRLGRSQILLRRFVRRCAPLTDALWSADAARVARALGLRSTPEFLMSTDMDAPFTAGVWRPRVIIPRSLVHAGRDLRESVLWHELAHVRRRDVAGRWLGALACALHWYNPLVWWAAHRLRQESEFASDDSVLSGGVSGATYVRLLMSLSGGPAGSPAPLAPGFGASELRHRIESIARVRDRCEPSRQSRYAMGLVTVILVLLAFQLHVPRPKLLFLTSEPEGVSSPSDRSRLTVRGSAQQ